MKKVKTSAPGKLMLFGEHSVVFGHPCIVTAVDRRLSITVEENGEEVFILDAPDLGLRAYSKRICDLGNKDLPKEVSFIETCYKLFLEKYPQQKTIHVYSKNEFKSSYGLGSSSASTVAFAKALSEFYEVPMNNDQLFDLAYQTVLEVQGVASGFDIAAAIWGGTIYYITPHGKLSKHKTVKPIKIKNLPLLVAYTGIKADTATLIRMVQNLHSENKGTVNRIFTDITLLVEQAKKTLQQQDWPHLGLLMDENQALLRKLQISSIELENLIAAGKSAGAMGAKLSGAGGGDCMLALVDEAERKAVAQKITKAGGKIIEVEMNAEGVRLEN
ncbi:mevalonate kinase [Patescibacteria group bacterium]|nr:mevalonate kinase [Patescibacteria group bacterium]